MQKATMKNNMNEWVSKVKSDCFKSLCLWHIILVNKFKVLQKQTTTTTTTTTTNIVSLLFWNYFLHFFSFSFFLCVTIIALNELLENKWLWRILKTAIISRKFKWPTCVTPCKQTLVVHILALKLNNKEIWGAVLLYPLKRHRNNMFSN